MQAIRRNDAVASMAAFSNQLPPLHFSFLKGQGQALLERDGKFVSFPRHCVLGRGEFLEPKHGFSVRREQTNAAGKRVRPFTAGMADMSHYDAVKVCQGSTMVGGSKPAIILQGDNLAVANIQERMRLARQDRSYNQRDDREEPAIEICFSRIQVPPKGVFPRGPEEDSKPNTRHGQCHFAGCRGVVELRPLNIKGLIGRSVHTPLATENRVEGNEKNCEPDTAGVR